MIVWLMRVAFVGAVMGAGAVQAGTITYYYGDDDCFGTDNPSCPDATIPPEYVENFSATYGQPDAEPFNPDTGIGDPFGHENFNGTFIASGQSLTWTHTVSLAGLNVTGAAIRLRTGGLADLKGPYTISLNNITVGEIPIVTGSLEDMYRVKLWRFAFDPALVLEGLNTVKLTRAVDNRPADGFTWDFAALTLTTRDAVPQIAEPATLATLIAGLLGVAAVRRRRGVGGLAS